jgi:Amt family ammonium transporter
MHARKSISLYHPVLGALLLLFSPLVLAQETPVLDTGNTAWMLTATAMVLFMTIPGLAFFYAGLVRSKNVLSVLMQVFAITSLVTILWAIYAYSLAFTNGAALNPWIGSLDKAFLGGVGVDTLSGSIPETVFITFQLTFAIITPALMVGAFAERMKFSAMMLFMALWLTFVYAPICHNVWGGGWLAQFGILDFAGGTVVHINAGVAGLVAALVLGKRKGYGATAMPPHNLGMSMAGAAMLWVGWFGFNAGSAVAANGTAGMAMVVTQIATATAALAWMFAEWIAKGKPSLLGIITGAVGGLVAITPASGSVGPMGALAIGAIAGVACYWGATSLKNALGYDDSLDVFGVHGVGGIVGALLTGVFSAAALGGAGLASGHETILSQFRAQAIGVIATIVYTGILSYVLLKIVDLIVGLRVSHDEETEGLDLALHNETGYNL